MGLSFLIVPVPTIKHSFNDLNLWPNIREVELVIHLLSYKFVAILPSAVDAILSVINGLRSFIELKKILFNYSTLSPKFLIITLIPADLNFFTELLLTRGFLST